MILALALPMLAVAEPFRIGRDDIIELRADTAWEDEAPDIVHFSGHFEMRVRDWLLVADEATVRGPLEDPELIEAKGRPASMTIGHGTADHPEPVTAEALHIIYQRGGKSVLLDGAVVLVQGESVLRSDHVEYELETDRLRASGVSGVQISLPMQEPSIP